MTTLIPFDKLPAVKPREEVKMRNTFIIDRGRLLELLAPTYGYRISLDKVCKASGLSGQRSSENWSETAVLAIANTHGIPVESFATPRPYNTVGRPKERRNRKCPKVVPIPEELQGMVTKASHATGMDPQAWVQAVLKACATFTVAPDVTQGEV